MSLVKSFSCIVSVIKIFHKAFFFLVLFCGPNVLTLLYVMCFSRALSVYLNMDEWRSPDGSTGGPGKSVLGQLSGPL